MAIAYCCVSKKRSKIEDKRKINGQRKEKSNDLPFNFYIVTFEDSF